MSDLSDTNLSVEDATTVNNNRVAVEALVEKKERGGGKYQKELVYNNYLPYSQLLDNESGKQTGGHWMQDCAGANINVSV